MAYFLYFYIDVYKCLITWLPKIYKGLTKKWKIDLDSSGRYRKTISIYRESML